MKKYLLLSFVLFMVAASAFAQIVPRVLDAKNVKRCLTMDRMEEAIRKDPALPAKWKKEGEKQYNAYLQRLANRKGAKTEAAEIIIPIVFHLVDVDSAQAWITDHALTDASQRMHTTRRQSLATDQSPRQRHERSAAPTGPVIST